MPALSFFPPHILVWFFVVAVAVLLYETTLIAHEPFRPPRVFNSLGGTYRINNISMPSNPELVSDSSLSSREHDESIKIIRRGMCTLIGLLERNRHFIAIWVGNQWQSLVSLYHKRLKTPLTVEYPSTLAAHVGLGTRPIGTCAWPVKALVGGLCFYRYWFRKDKHHNIVIGPDC